MAVEIPVVIDIDKAFEDAAKRVPDAIKPLQSQISKKQLNVAIDVGTNQVTMRKFKDLLNDSHVDATQLEKALEHVNTQINQLAKKGGFNPTKGLKQSEKDLLALRAALETKLEGGNFIDNATEKLKKMAIGSKEAANGIKSTNSALSTQGGILGRLTKYLSIYTAFFSGLRLIHNIRETTAEFEMQRVALGGIIQDTTKANQLFAEIKAAAVKSPFQIKELVSFTKQLSAYRIETENLFKVTMQLADVSAGLGVDMSRLVLAYGQVRAASVLRGQELRQFTEAGIPLVDLLAKKFTQLRGELVSTGEVFELISERAVPFSMIEDIFNDMTSAGGIFYEMQLKQSETLKGQWMKLKDVISITYDEIGRTEVVGSAMRGLINLISVFVRHWEALASVVNVAIFSFLTYKAATKGLIPFYNLQQKAIARQIQLEKQREIEMIRLASATGKLTRAEQKRIESLSKMTAEDYRSIYAMDKMTLSQAMMCYWRNKDNKEIVKAIEQTGLLTKKQMKAISSMNAWQIRLKTWGVSIRTLFQSVSTAIMSFWPIAAISAVISGITELVGSIEEQNAAIKRVDDAYREQGLVLSSIENAYRRIQQAIDSVENAQERATKEASLFGQKLDLAAKIVENLRKYGLGGDIDLSILNTANIDRFIEDWLEKMNEANELTREWGRSVAVVANDFELNILGWSIAGENLKSDIKDLTSAFVALTANKEYLQSQKNMRSYLETLETTHKQEYDLLSQTLGEEAKLAVEQRRRNETEYQYQKRLIKNYEIIRQFAQSDRNILRGNAAFFKNMDSYLKNFEKELSEVEREFDKTWGSFEGKDELTIKMAIDKVFAENQWEDWLKEAWIERVNQKYQMNIQIVPTIGTVKVNKGMKSIIASEFEGLFTEQELEGLNSIEEIGKAIEEKFKKAAESVKEADKLANNFAKTATSDSAAIAKIKKAQLTIDEEMRKSEKDRNNELIKQSIETIDAITKKNGAYEEQILKKKEVAKANYELAKSAKARLLSENISDVGRDIKQAFPNLIKDAFKDITDENYIGKFLISDDELLKIKDISDLYDLWAKNTKAIKEEKEKLEGVGMSEKTISERQLEIDSERLRIKSELAEVESGITSDYEALKDRYDSLKLDLASATTSNERAKAQEKLNAFLKETKFAEAAALVLQRQSLQAQLEKTNEAENANQRIREYIQYLDDAETAWEELGKRENFTLKEKTKGGYQQDPWILIFKNRMKFMQDFQKGVEDLNKYLIRTDALGRVQETMSGRGLALNIDTKDLVGTSEELVNWYDKTIEEIKKKIYELGGTTWSGLGVQAILAKDTKSRTIKAWQELLAEVFKQKTDFETSNLKKSLEDNLKKLSAEIKRSEVARNFYNEILGMTGDEQFATTMTMNIYGDIGDEFKERMQKELNGLLDSLKSDTSFSVTPDIENAFKNMDFKTLLALDNLPDEIRKRLQEAYASAQKYDRDFITDLVKSYQKARTYEERIQAVRDRESKKREEIDADKAMSPEAKASYKAASEKKEQQEIADIEVERIKNMYVWTKTFEDLGNVSDKTLKQLIANLNLLIEKQGSAMSPEALKAVTQARDKAYDMVGERNPYAGIIKGLRDWGNATKKVNKLRREGKRGTIDELKALDEQKKAWNDAVKSASHLKDGLETLGNAVSSLSELFDYDETQGVKYVLDGIAEALTLVGTALVFVNAMMELLASNPLIIGATAIIALITAIVKAIEGARLSRINKEIERQQKLIDELERSYEQLEEAIQGAFGTEYVYKYNQMLENLYASAEAYRKQAEAERSKGKKANKDTISDYEDKAEEAIKKTSELTKELREFFVGENLASAAESFADSWLQAYREFGDTAGAIEERMHEMIDNLIKRSLLSEVAKNILGNWYQSISDIKVWDAETIAKLWGQAEDLVAPMVEGMKIYATQLQEQGKSLRGTAGSFTGIARNIANASEESINGLAAGINTQNYYMQHIDQVVSAILLQIGGGAENSEDIASPNPYQEAVLTQLSALPQMRDDMASIRSMLDKVIKPNGIPSTHRVIIG